MPAKSQQTDTLNERILPMKRFFSVPEYPQSFFSYNNVSTIGETLGITLCVPTLDDHYFIYFLLKPNNIVLKEDKSQMSIEIETPTPITEGQLNKFLLLNKERIVQWVVQWLLYKTYPTSFVLNWP